VSGRLAIDFGTSNTVLALWDAARAEGISVFLPDYGRPSLSEGEQVSVIPSVIHYGSDNRRWIGNQVLERDLYHAPATFRWMKSYIARRSPGKKRINGNEISHFDAGKDFLSTVLLFAAQEYGIAGEEVALTLPVEAFEDYENWLTEVAEAAGMPRFRLIDEPAAAALGYGMHIQPGDVYLVFDFGGGSLDVALVLVEEATTRDGNRRCRVLGKAGSDRGGVAIDQWLFEEVLARTGRNEADDNVRAASNVLLVQCEAAKERLSFHERADIAVEGSAAGPAIRATFTRGEFEEVLDAHDFFAELDRTIRRAIADARERGYGEDAVKGVLMVGGSSQIPAVQQMLKRIFGKDRVFFRRPLDAVARGAAAFVAGVDFYDHIQHDYAIRHLDRERGTYEYWPIVRRGTPYPTREPAARITVKASYDGQRELGLVLFEVGSARSRGKGSGVEIEYDPGGAARLRTVSPEEEERRTYFQIGTPAFLRADPPAERGERRFEIMFGIDGNKRLLISVRDVKTGQWTHRDYPMVKLV
jgi:molecular chaperone DnaK